jgi:hypothetical protein
MVVNKFIIDQVVFAIMIPLVQRALLGDFIVENALASQPFGDV